MGGGHLSAGVSGGLGGGVAPGGSGAAGNSSTASNNSWLFGGNQSSLFSSSAGSNAGHDRSCYLWHSVLFVGFGKIKIKGPYSSASLHNLLPETQSLKDTVRCAMLYPLLSRGIIRNNGVYTQFLSTVKC